MSFYAKSVSFWPNEWIFKYSDKIMSCKLWSKVTSVFLNINFCAKMSILGKNNWILKSWLFETIVQKSEILENMLIFRNVWMSIYIKKLSKLIKTSISQHQFLCKNVNFWSSVRNLDFLKLLSTTTESEYLIGKHAHFQKIVTFCVMSIYIKKLSKMIKTSIFLRKCLFYMC